MVVILVHVHVTCCLHSKTEQSAKMQMQAFVHYFYKHMEPSVGRPGWL